LIRYAALRRFRAFLSLTCDSIGIENVMPLIRDDSHKSLKEQDRAG
jgi:hypothetical protein